MSKEKPFLKAEIQQLVRVRRKESLCQQQLFSLLQKGGQAHGELLLFPCPSDGKHKLCPSIALQVHLLYAFPIIKPKAGICLLSNNPHFLWNGNYWSLRFHFNPDSLLLNKYFEMWL